MQTQEGSIAVSTEHRGPEAEYRRRLGQGTFEIQRCDSCARHFFFPRVLCPHCGSGEVSWVRPCGRATVYSTTVVRRRAEEGGDYNVAIVQLAEGPRLMSRVEELPPADVRIGAAVEARIDGTGAEAVLVFIPAKGRASHG
jgi:uncharacterized OB-fold protein